MPDWKKFANDYVDPTKIKIQRISHQWECPKIADFNVDGIMRDVTQEDVDQLSLVKEAYGHLRYRLLEALREVDAIIVNKNANAAEVDEMSDSTQEEIDHWYNSRTEEQDNQREKNGWIDPLDEHMKIYEEYLATRPNPEYKDENISINT